MSGVGIQHAAYWPSSVIRKYRTPGWRFWQTIKVELGRSIDGPPGVDCVTITIDNWSAEFYRMELPDLLSALEEALHRQVPDIRLVASRNDKHKPTVLALPPWSGWPMVDILREIIEGVVGAPETPSRAPQVAQGVYR